MTVLGNATDWPESKWNETRPIAVQAVTYAGGSFDGAWFVATGIEGDQAHVPKRGTVKIYRFSADDAGPIMEWRDLWGLQKSPTTVADMIWSPIGPCPLAQDALYLGAATSDDPNLTADPDTSPENDPGAGDPGGIYCFDANKKLGLVADSSCRTLDRDLGGGFMVDGAKGELYSRI